MESTLKEYFGFANFRPFQKEIITKILQGQDCLVVMATGSGKSLCYQLPPLISKNAAVVISPLISLMQDQVMALKERGIKAEYLGSAQTDSGVAAKARAGEYALLFLTPEKALSLPDSFWSALACRGLSLLAIDEAHCISEWGHDFRKEYQQLQTLRRVLKNIPFVALTATATDRVRRDIRKSLQLRNPFEVVSSFNRPNIFYGAKYISRSHAFREELAHEVMKDCKSGGSTIIYCTTIKDVEEVTEALVQAGVDARPYHGQMKQKDREVVHRAFAQDELQIVVATVAFGMGIDKPDIRRVIHYGCPKSLESYYQESGRCGRDGLPSTCWLYYTRGDFSKSDFYTAEAQSETRRKVVLDVYQAAQKYCQITSCRRKFVLEYFGENDVPENCGHCDNCTRLTQINHRDMSEEVHLLLACVNLCGGRFGINMPIDILRGSHSKKIIENGFEQLPVYGLGSSKSPNWWKSLADQLLANGYLVESRRDIYRFVNVGGLGNQFLQTASKERLPFFLTPTQEMIEEEIKKGGFVDPTTIPRDLPEMTSRHTIHGLSESETKLCESLLKERANLAKRNFTAPYAICSERTLQNLAKVRPSSRARLLNVDGVNQWLVKKHGDEILAAIQNLSADLGLSLDSAEKPLPELHLMSNVTKSNQGSDIKATPAKVEAWRMWQENNMLIYEIANLPDRPKPIKEETVAQYIMDCCRLGYKLDWQRFSDETGFSKVVKEVEAGVERAGAVDKLKLIKEQVPEHVSYLHIQIYLMMKDLNLPCPNAISKNTESDLEAEAEPALHVKDSEGQYLPHVCQEVPTREFEDSSKPPWMDSVHSSPSRRQKRAPIWNSDVPQIAAETLQCKRTKEDDVCAKDLVGSLLPLTEEGFMVWLSKHDGVSMNDMLLAFPTEEESLKSFLANLEGEFLIYRKDDMYRVM